MKSLEGFPERLFALLIPWLVLLALPFIYFFSELHATLTIEIAGAAGAACCGFLLFTGRMWTSGIFRAALALLVTWLFLAGRSIFISVAPSTSWPVFIKAAALGMLCLTSAASIAATRHYRFFYHAAAWAGIIHGIIALNEYVEAPPIPVTWLDPAAKSLFRTRCAGIFTDPNIFAAFLAVVFLLTLGLLLSTRSSSERVLAGLSLAWSGFAILTTLSRGGWIGLGAGLTGLLVLYLRSGFSAEIHSRRVLTFVSLFLLIIFFAGPFKMRFSSIGNPTDMTFAQRTLINKGIFNSISRFPIAGHGLHSFNQVYPRYRMVGGDYPMNAHNEFIHSMMETGFLSSLVLIALCLLLFKASVKFFPGRFPHIAFLGVSFLTLLVQNLSGFSSRILPTSALIAIIAGGILSFSCKPATCKAKISLFNRCAALILFFIAGLIAWMGFTSFSIQQQIQTAGEYMRNGQVPQAIAVLQETAMREPDNPSIYAMLASAFLQSGTLEQASLMWQKAAGLNPTEAIFFINLARMTVTDNSSAAEEFYQRALFLDPASEQFRLEFARFLIAQKRDSEALAQLQVGMAFSPGFHDVYTGFKDIEQLKNHLTR